MEIENQDQEVVAAGLSQPDVLSTQESVGSQSENVTGVEEQAVRMSSRVASQGGAGSMEERHLAQQSSRDLSGTNLTFYNSFAALDDDVIMHRALEMGVDASSVSLDHINSLK